MAVADTMVVQACVNCHNTIAESPKKDWKLGDVRGVLEVTSVIDAELATGAALSRAIIIGAILIGLGLLGIALLVAGSVTRPIEQLIGAMQKVAAGNFETVLPGLGRKDEIGRLAGGFNRMVSELGAARKARGRGSSPYRDDAGRTRACRAVDHNGTNGRFNRSRDQPALRGNRGKWQRKLALACPYTAEFRRSAVGFGSNREGWTSCQRHYQGHSCHLQDG